jgi:hypothetical protein
MSDPTDSFPSNPDLYRLLAQMYGVGLFTPPLASGWSDPSLALPPGSDLPGFDKSPAVLEALSAADPRPPGFYRSTALLGARALLPTPDPNLPTIGQQAMLFGGPGSTLTLPPLPAPWSDYVRARYTPDSSLASNTGAPAGSDLTSAGNPFASLPMGGPQSVSTTSNPYLIPVRADSTPMTGPQAISRPIGEPPVPSVDPSDIFARAGLPRPLPMSVPTSPPASGATDDHGGANSGGPLAFLGPVGAAIRSAAVPAAEAVAAMGVGPLLAALASGAAVLFYPSKLGDDSCTPPNCGNQYVLRGGLAAPADIQKGVTVVKGFEPMTGFSVTSAPNMTLDQLAKYAQYPNAMISFTTTQELARMGYPVAPTPLSHPHPDPLHSTVQTPMPLPDAEAQAIGGAFGRKMPNLYRRERGAGKNLSVLNER